MDPVTLFLLASGAAAAGKAIGGAVQARAAKKSFTPSMETELKRLQALQKKGQLGLTTAEMEMQRESMIAQSQGELEAQKAQISQGLSSRPSSARDLFMGQQAAMQAGVDNSRAIAGAIAEQDSARRSEQLQSLAALQANQTRAIQGRAAGISQAFGGVGDAAFAGAQLVAKPMTEKGLANAQLGALQAETAPPGTTFSSDFESYRSGNRYNL